MTLQPDPHVVELASRLLWRLGGRGQTAATAESLSGGLVSAALTAIPGSSEVFRGGVVVYATDTKASVLGVDAGILEREGPVSPVTAAAMSVAVRELFDADLGIATTGVAGPDPVGDVPPGVIYLAISLDEFQPQVLKLEALGDRTSVRTTCVIEALSLALQALGNDDETRE